MKNIFHGLVVSLCFLSSAQSKTQSLAGEINEMPPVFYDPDGARTGLRVSIVRIIRMYRPLSMDIGMEGVSGEGILVRSDDLDKAYGVRVWTPQGMRLDKSVPPKPDHPRKRLGNMIRDVIRPGKIKTIVGYMFFDELARPHDEQPVVFQLVRYFEKDPCALLSAPMWLPAGVGPADPVVPEGYPPEPYPSERDREIARTLQFDLDGDLSGLRLRIAMVQLDRDRQTCRLSMGLENVANQDIRVKADDEGREYAVRFWTTRGHYLGGRTLPDPFPFEPKHEKGLEYVLAPGGRVAAGEVHSDALDQAVFEQPVLAQVYRVVEQGPYVLISPPILIEPGDGVIDLSGLD